MFTRHWKNGQFGIEEFSCNGLTQRARSIYRCWSIWERIVIGPTNNKVRGAIKNRVLVVRDVSAMPLVCRWDYVGKWRSKLFVLAYVPFVEVVGHMGQRLL